MTRIAEPQILTALIGHSSASKINAIYAHVELPVKRSHPEAGSMGRPTTKSTE
jgi:hypothetical protein